MHSVPLPRFSPRQPRCAAVTHAGSSRPCNDDAVAMEEAIGVFAVADGVGGRPAGDVASLTAVASLTDHVALYEASLDRVRRGDAPSGLLARIAQSAFAEAAFEVASHSANVPGLEGMCTTLTGLLIAGRQGAIAHAGDSRAYRVRGSHGDIVQLTDDHNLTGDLVRRGDLDARKAALSPWSNVLTRYLGLCGPDVEPQIVELEIADGDIYVLCTDGLTKYVRDDEIATTVSRLAPAAAADLLVRSALARGGADDVSAIVVRPPPAA